MFQSDQDVRILAMICCLLCPLAFATFAVVGRYQTDATNPAAPDRVVVAMAVAPDAAK